MDLGIRGRKAIVNGGSAGMGRSAVLSLAREGVECFVSARGGDRLAQACAEIAAETFASESTVKTHVGAILRKLALRDRVQIVVFAHEHGLVR